jgi:hypothetical protein
LEAGGRRPDSADIITRPSVISKSKCNRHRSHHHHSRITTSSHSATNSVCHHDEASSRNPSLPPCGVSDERLCASTGYPRSPDSSIVDDYQSQRIWQQKVGCYQGRQGRQGPRRGTVLEGRVGLQGLWIHLPTCT